jgi:hypothetical protein
MSDFIGVRIEIISHVSMTPLVLRRWCGMATMVSKVSSRTQHSESLARAKATLRIRPDADEMAQMAEIFE